MFWWLPADIRHPFIFSLFTFVTYQGCCPCWHQWTTS